MSLHTADVANRLRGFLDRRTMPRLFEGKPAAIKAEVDALTAAVARYAPQGDALREWWPGFEARLAEANQTRVWPSEGEVKAAAIAGRAPAVAAQLQSTPDEMALEIAAKRIAAGEAVGDGFLYGRQALDLERRGMVSPADLRKYRSALYFTLKETYVEAIARRMEAELIARHDAARDLVQGPLGRSSPIPDKRRVDTGAAA